MGTHLCLDPVAGVFLLEGPEGLLPDLRLVRLPGANLMVVRPASSFWHAETRGIRRDRQERSRTALERPPCRG